MALGWGLWEGPARFYFWTRFFPFINPAFTRQESISPCRKIDFRKKWNKIPQARPLYDLFRNESNEHRASIGGVATVGVVDKPGCGIFIAAITNARAAIVRNQWPL